MSSTKPIATGASFDLRDRLNRRLPFGCDDRSQRAHCHLTVSRMSTSDALKLATLLSRLRNRTDQRGKEVFGVSRGLPR